MDKTGMFWGAFVGAIWGILYFFLDWPLAKDLVKHIDTGFYTIASFRPSNLFGGFTVLATLFGGLGLVIGGMIGSGRTRY